MPFTIVEKEHHDIYPAIDPKGKLSGAAADKVVVLTGAGKGIGEAIAHAFAAAGAKGIVIAARTEKDLDKVETDIKKTNPKTQVLKVVTDVTSKDSVKNLFSEAFNKFNEVDVLINNAGMLERGFPVAESDIDTWCRVWDVNVKGTYLPTRYFLTQPSFEGKTIINTSSMGALLKSDGLSAYQSTKTAVIHFTEFLNLEHGKQGLRAFVYHPGGVPTDLALTMPKHMHSLLVDQPALAGGYTVWLTTPAADFLKGRYSSCCWDIDELVAKKSEIEAKNLLTCGITGLNAGAAQ